MLRNVVASRKIYRTLGHMQEICLSAKQGKEVLKVPPPSGGTLSKFLTNHDAKKSSLNEEFLKEISCIWP